ncbi:MAG: hypothetical protein QSU88_10815, partial [Candidatus Methanoperedens sp.]|nr:hypothetical protein [Candidatus Methanoperedens sp.]
PCGDPLDTLAVPYMFAEYYYIHIYVFHKFRPKLLNRQEKQEKIGASKKILWSDGDIKVSIIY